MNKDRQLMQQALDALENSVDLVREDAYQAEKLYGNYPTRQGKVNGLKVLADDHEKSIIALRERLAQPEQEPEVDERIKSVRHMRDVQGYDGNWNYDPYMQGLYNGIEFALSLLEVREPQFKDAPETWLGDIKVKRDKFGTEAAHGIKGKNT